MPTYQLVRDIPLEEGYDICVLGGGPAGAAAAICAARLGARVLLVEATGCLGGTGTSGLVTAFDPMANGEEMLVGGLMREIVDALCAQGELGPKETPESYAKEYMHWTPFRVEGYKRLLDKLAVDAGVEVRFFTRLIDADADRDLRRVRGVVVHNIEGYRYIRAKAFVDGTGDAVLSDLVGAACREAGRDTPRIMPATLCSLFAGLDFDRQGGLEQQWTLAWKATEQGFFTQRDRLFPGMFRAGNQVGDLNAGHMFNLNALRCRDLSDGVMLGRRLAKEYMEFFRTRVPGCEKIEHVTTAAIVGVRESRRIVGEYELTFDDYLARRKPADTIGLFNKFVDVHPYDCSDAEWERFHNEHQNTNLRLLPGESFGIPYRILVPKGWSNLWVAGRCASTDVKTHGVIRVQPSCAMMGQAAGTAAVQACHTGQAACGLDTTELVATLRRQGAKLPA